MLYPVDMSKEDIAEFQAEYDEWYATEVAHAEMERKFLQQNSVELSEELYSPFWGA